MVHMLKMVYHKQYELCLADRQYLRLLKVLDEWTTVVDVVYMNLKKTFD